MPSRAAASAFTHGRNEAAERSGNVRRRFARSPFGSIAMAGTPSMAASSSRPMARPVFPLPVMPMMAACVTRSRES